MPVFAWKRGWYAPWPLIPHAIDLAELCPYAVKHGHGTLLTFLNGKPHTLKPFKATLFAYCWASLCCC